MKKLLTLLLIVTVSFASANTTDSKSGYDSNSYDSSYLLEKKNNQFSPDLDISIKTHGLPPFPGQCPPNPYNSQTGCSCIMGVVTCHIK